MTLNLGIEQLGLNISDQETVKLQEYLKLLQKWNKVYNLTAIRNPNEMVSHHLLDSLAVLPHIWQGCWLDVGCGGGLPGIVLAIARPDCEFTLLDSNGKKTSFVQQAIIELELRNAKVICARVEDWNPQRKFDGIISRAFSELSEFLRLTRHLKSLQGRWVAMKGNPNQELLSLPEGCYIESVQPLQIPGLDAARSLVIANCRENVSI
jgi:16S rRNA (guanine527-N7)-methyltransferase